MEPLTDSDPVFALVEQIVRCGLLLTEVVATLVDDLPENAFPGENSVEVLLEMIAGSVRPAAVAAGERAVTDATALVGAVLDRTLGDLRELSSMA